VILNGILLGYPLLPLIGGIVYGNILQWLAEKEGIF